MSFDHYKEEHGLDSKTLLAAVESEQQELSLEEAADENVPVSEHSSPD